MIATLIAAASLGAAQSHPANIVETAVQAKSFPTLVSLVQAADLAEPLQGKGPFTVFAPSEEAFAKLPDELVRELKGNKRLLRAVLGYHVVPGRVSSGQAARLTRAGTILEFAGKPQNLSIRAKNGRLIINQSLVSKADIGASNGVIHVIDTVLLPPADVLQSLRRH
jgi:uncharacterized surface protein with fasciclin (FAS1) repeats